MVREIKFRMWSKEYKKMFPHESLCEMAKGLQRAANTYCKITNLDMNKPLPEGIYLPLSDDDAVFMQYTGMKDKNGKEIFEGDIVTFSDDYGTYRGIRHTAVIKYIPTMFYAETRTKKHTGDGWYRPLLCGHGSCIRDIEVIGDIYEKPELLEVERGGV